MGANYFLRSDRDTRFVLFEQLDLGRVLGYPAFVGLSREEVSNLIDGALSFARESIGPTLQDGDREGCRFEAGEVYLPESFHDCWQGFQDHRFVTLTGSREFGGRGLPSVVGGMIREFFFGANLAMSIYPTLTAGNARLIEVFGTDEDRAMFVEKMYTGQWGGTMCLTEPESGSDVGYLTTEAVPDPDSDDPRIYRIEGRKRFITCGRHDLTENIIHLLLARIKGGPPGTKGVSLFIVPQRWLNPDGSPGPDNDVICRSIERKMGLHASATCSLKFGSESGCRGILLGEPHSGMAKMFRMMNEARLATGLMAQAVAASAYDKALAYAKVRRQGPPLADRQAERVRIIEHEDVRRMLLGLKSGTEAMRAMIAHVYYLQDVAHHEPDEEERLKAAQRVDLFTPLVKASCSDLAALLIRDAIQVHGGLGYCSEFPVEQYYRDAKITSIWEGTSYIQALDLIGRKLTMEGGQVFKGWLTEVMGETNEYADDPDFGPEYKTLFTAAQAVGAAAMAFLRHFRNQRTELIGLNATGFQESMAEVLMARLILEQGRLARELSAGLDEGSDDWLFYQGKIGSAKFFCRNVLPNGLTRQAILESEDVSALEIPEGAF